MNTCMLSQSFSRLVLHVEIPTRITFVKLVYKTEVMACGENKRCEINLKHKLPLKIHVMICR